MDKAQGWPDLSTLYGGQSRRTRKSREDHPISGACEMPHAGRDAKLEDVKMLIPRLLRETGSDPVVCPRKYGLLKKKAWQKMHKLEEVQTTKVMKVVISAMNRKCRSIFNS